MEDPLTAILKPSRSTVIVDIGANPIDGEPPYSAMLKAGLCEVFGFEPQQEALATLRRAATAKETYLPYVVADGRQGTLRICRAQGMTSLLEPDPQQLALFNLFPNFGAVLEERQVDTVRLDDIDEISELDFLKIDVQGSELIVFHNGRKCLGNAVAVQTEVSFVPLYLEQPTLGEVDCFLRELDFIPHCFSQIKRWSLAPTVFSSNPRKPGNQLLESDIVFVKDFSSLATMESEKVKHLALLSHHVFQSYDLVNLALIALQNRGEIAQDSTQRYHESFALVETK